MMRRFAILSLVCALAACATSPEPDYFSLAIEPGTVSSAPAVIVKVQTPVIAGYLDRPDFVRQDGDHQLLIDEKDNWAEPVDSMFARILAGDLQQRLPDCVILTEDNATPANTRFVVDLTIQRFNPVAGGDVVLDGELVVTDKVTHAQVVLMPLHITGAADGSADEVAAGLSHLIGLAADQIAARMAVLAAQTAPVR